MTLQTTPTRPRQFFRVCPGLRVEAVLSEASTIAIQLSVDEALSLAMVLLYEAREQAAILKSKAEKQQ